VILPDLWAGTLHGHEDRNAWRRRHFNQRTKFVASKFGKRRGSDLSGHKFLSSGAGQQRERQGVWRWRMTENTKLYPNWRA
jgi:hypothetical protein